MNPECRTLSTSPAAPLRAFQPYPAIEACAAPGTERCLRLAVIDGLVSVTQQAWGLAGSVQ